MRPLTHILILLTKFDVAVYFHRFSPFSPLLVHNCSHFWTNLVCSLLLLLLLPADVGVVVVVLIFLLSFYVCLQTESILNNSLDAYLQINLNCTNIRNVCCAPFTIIHFFLSSPLFSFSFSFPLGCCWTLDIVQNSKCQHT